MIITYSTATAIPTPTPTPPATTPTAKPPMFQIGYDEQALLVMAALGIATVLLRKKD